jgi:hypothetical protein
VTQAETIDSRLTDVKRFVTRRFNAWYAPRKKRVHLLLAALVLCLIGVAVFVPWYYWTDPVPVPGDFNELSDKYESSLSGDGNMLVIARDTEAGRSDLFILRRDGDSWSTPVTLDGINTRHNETDPVFSEDGQYLLFASDRPAGKGGQDIWIARWDGATWAIPVNAGWGVNSAFDESGPAISSNTNRLFFSSNRPKRRLTTEERTISDRELRRRFAGEDSDLYVSERIGDLPVDPLSPYAYRNPGQINEDMVEQLGGSLKTELAVTRALKWLAQHQEPDGRWSNRKHGGAGGHDVGATAMTMMCFLGRGISHKTDSEYREAVSKAIDWLLSVIQPDGDLRQGNFTNGMYSQGIGTMGLAEAYGLSKDERLRKPAQAAVDFIIKAQDARGGGWRYVPGQAGDMSVFGWQVMALKSAKLAGLSVPDATLEKAQRWMAFVAGGPNGGLYGYATKSHVKPAMVAEGFYARQLLSPDTIPARTAESVAYLSKVSLNDPVTDYTYFLYYMTLAMYLHQGDPWDIWNEKMKKELLSAQHRTGNRKGTWPIKGVHGVSMGTLITTAISTLCLEIYYRYVPGYDWFALPSANGVNAREDDSGVSSRPRTEAARSQDATRPVPVVMPHYGLPVSLDAANSPAFDVQPTITAEGNYLYFASDREGGTGGADLYRCRVSDDKVERARKLRRYVNSQADETDPVIHAKGRLLLLSSNRESASGLRYRLYSSQLLRVTPKHLISKMLQSLMEFLSRAKWWLILLLLALWAILYLLRRLSDDDRNRQYSLLQKCILASLILHLFGLLLTAFWRISTVVADTLGDSSMEVTIDANALSQERLALEIRETLSKLPTASSIFIAEQIEAPAPAPDTPQNESPAEVIEAESPSEPFMIEPSPAPPVEAELEAELPEIIAAVPEIELPPLEIRMEEDTREIVEAEEATIASSDSFEISHYKQEELPQSEAVQAVSQVEIQDQLIKTHSPPVKRVEASTDSKMPDLDRVEPAVDVPPPELIVEMEKATAESDDASEREMPKLAAGRAAQQHASTLPDSTPEALQAAALTPVDAPAVESALKQSQPHVEAKVRNDVREFEQTFTNITMEAIASTLIMESREVMTDASDSLPEITKVSAAVRARPFEHSKIDRGSIQSEAATDVYQAPTLPGPVESALRATAAAESGPSTDSTAVANVSRSATRVPDSRPAGDLSTAVAMFEMESAPSRGSGDEGVTASQDAAIGQAAIRSKRLKDSAIDGGGPQTEGIPASAAPPSSLPGQPKSAVRASFAKESRHETGGPALAKVIESATRIPDAGSSGDPHAVTAMFEMETAPSRGRGSGEEGETASADTTMGQAAYQSSRLEEPTISGGGTPSEGVSVTVAQQASIPGPTKSAVREASPAESKLTTGGTALANVSESATRLPHFGPAGDPSAKTPVLKMEFGPHSVQGSGDDAGIGSSVAAMATAGGVSLGQYQPAPDGKHFGRASPWHSDLRAKPASVLDGRGVSELGVTESQAPTAGNVPALVSAVMDPGAPALPIPPSLARSAEISAPYALRRSKRSEQLLKKLGGSPETEQAVQLALKWLSKTQEKDGRWSVQFHGGEEGHDPALTGLALLCFLGWGADHIEEGPYQSHVSRGLDWLITSMRPDGDFRVSGAKKAMYSQGIAALAITEAYGLTRDQKLKVPAQKSVDFIVSAQNRDDGAWRYIPREPGDTSVMGWMVMVLVSAELAGLDVPTETLQLTKKWFPRVAGGIEGGLYGYRTPEPRPAMVAEGMFSMQLLGAPRASAAMRESATYIHMIPPISGSRSQPYYYYWYYGTLALYQHGGPMWAGWNERMKTELVGEQITSGPDAGSWNPTGMYAMRAGRIASTAMATLSLEVYYRYLPLYGFSELTKDEELLNQDGN